MRARAKRRAAKRVRFVLLLDSSRPAAIAGDLVVRVDDRMRTSGSFTDDELGRIWDAADVVPAALGHPVPARGPLTSMDASASLAKPEPTSEMTLDAGPRSAMVWPARRRMQ